MSSVVKKTWDEPHNVPMNPTGEKLCSNPSSPSASSLLGSASVISEISEYSEKSSEVRQLELNLNLACRNGSIHQVRMLLAMCPQGVNTVDVNGNTPLSIACKYGRMDAVELLLKEGAMSTTLTNTAVRLSPEHVLGTTQK